MVPKLVEKMERPGKRALLSFAPKLFRADKALRKYEQLAARTKAKLDPLTNSYGEVDSVVKLHSILKTGSGAAPKGLYKTIKGLDNDKIGYMTPDKLEEHINTLKEHKRMLEEIKGNHKVGIYRDNILQDLNRHIHILESFKNGTVPTPFDPSDPNVLNRLKYNVQGALYDVDSVHKKMKKLGKELDGYNQMAYFAGNLAPLVEYHFAFRLQPRKKAAKVVKWERKYNELSEKAGIGPLTEKEEKKLKKAEKKLNKAKEPLIADKVGILTSTGADIPDADGYYHVIHIDGKYLTQEMRNNIDSYFTGRRLTREVEAAGTAAAIAGAKISDKLGDVKRKMSYLASEKARLTGENQALQGQQTGPVDIGHEADAPLPSNPSSQPPTFHPQMHGWLPDIINNMPEDMKQIILVGAVAVAGSAAVAAHSRRMKKNAKIYEQLVKNPDKVVTPDTPQKIKDILQNYGSSTNYKDKPSVYFTKDGSILLVSPKGVHA